MCTGNTGVLVQSVLLCRHKRGLGETKQGKTARNKRIYFDVLLTVHLSMILVINQLDEQNLVLQ